MGTVDYMSPEQASGEPVDFRSDQFALGSVLYEMATGRPAFSRKTKPETLAAIIREEPEPIASLTPKAPAPLRWIVERCLVKDPDGRYASTEDLVCCPKNSFTIARNVCMFGHVHSRSTTATGQEPTEAAERTGEFR